MHFRVYNIKKKFQGCLLKECTSSTNNMYMVRLGDHKPVLGLFPARIREISNPRLKAWLNMRRVWKVDTNGNHEKNATGMKMSIPIPASNKRASERIDFHNPSFFTYGFQAEAICKSIVSFYVNSSNGKLVERNKSEVYKTQKF